MKRFSLLSCLLVFTTLFLNNFTFGQKSRNSSRRRQHELLQFGDKCIIPRQGGELSIVNECDASKGLVCDGKACVCTLSDYFAYDAQSDECRKKLGKSCRPTKEDSELLELPFHLKCHSTATCTVVSRKMMLDGEAAGNSKHVINGFTMCVCRYGYEPNQNLDGCHTPSPNIVLEPFRQAVQINYEEDED